MLRGISVSIGCKKAFVVALVGLAATLVGPSTSASKTDNNPPLADAGADQSVWSGDTVALDGSASSDLDGDLLDYRWSLTSTPSGSLASILDPHSVRPGFIADLAGLYVAQLIVSDGQEERGPDTALITTENSAPTAEAGADQTVSRGEPVQLDGSASSDPDGDDLGFSWSLISLPNGSRTALSDPEAVDPSFALDKHGHYVAQLIVDDGILDSAPDTVILSTTNGRPVADAGPDQTAVEQTVIQLPGGGSSDADGDPLTYAWSFVSLPLGSTAVLSDRTVANPFFTADLPGLYVAQLIVSDDMLASDPDSVVIDMALNTDPVITSVPVTETAVDERYVYDVEAVDEDGNSLTYSLPTAPFGMTIDADSGLVTWTPGEGQDGVHRVTVRVAETRGGEDTQSFNITVTWSAPVIADFDPKSGPVGTLVTIAGANFNPAPDKIPQVTMNRQGGGVMAVPKQQFSFWHESSDDLVIAGAARTRQGPVALGSRLFS